jgi:plastocyanin
VVAALLLGASATVTSAAAQAAQVTVNLTEDGPTPEFIEVPVGGTVVFVNQDDVAHRVVATEEAGKSTEWAYDSGAVDPGATSRPTDPFTSPGRYTFQDSSGVLLTERTFRDEIGVLPAPSPTPSPDGSDDGSGQPQPTSGPSASPGATPGSGGSPAPGAGAPDPSGSASPGAPAVGGTGVTAPLPLSGGFAGTGTAPVPIPGDPLAPAIAPPLALTDEGPAPLPYIAAPLEQAPSVAALPTGSLPGVDTGRDRGLPAVLAALLVVGVVSLLVRVLLAEPAARRVPEAARGLRPVAVTG